MLRSYGVYPWSLYHFHIQKELDKAVTQLENEIQNKEDLERSPPEPARASI